MRTISERFDFSQLNAAERLSLIGELWDSLSEDEISIPEWHKQELDRIQKLDDSGKLSYSTWDEVKMRIFSRK